MTAIVRTRAELRALRLAAMREQLMRDLEERAKAIEAVAAWPLPDQEPP